MDPTPPALEGEILTTEPPGKSQQLTICLFKLFLIRGKLQCCFGFYHPTVQISQNYAYILYMGFPSGSDGKVSACNVGDPGSILGQEDPLEKEMATHSSTLAYKIPWMEVGYSPWGRKESDTTERLHFTIHISPPSWASLPSTIPPL